MSITFVMFFCCSCPSGKVERRCSNFSRDSCILFAFEILAVVVADLEIFDSDVDLVEKYFFISALRFTLNFGTEGLITIRLK